MLTILPSSAAPFDLATLPAGPIHGLYVHIPFCFHKCHYCDFYSITGQNPQRMQQFVDRLLTEAERWERAEPNNPQHIRTVFFGGGTPSLLPLPDMQRLIAGLRDRLNLSAVQEWTIECNPATVSGEYCSMLRSAGVNRLSFGAQSFHRRELATLERHHDPDDVPRSLELARSAGFKRLNIDLIYAIPGQTMDDWQATLEQAIAQKLLHYSCYGLTYEPNTPITAKRNSGLLVQAEESLELAMMHHTRDRLAALGKPAYEISNYASPGQECQHNLMYWRGGNYLAIGPSAASHVEGHRWKNRPHLGEWEAAVDRGDWAVIDYETLTPAQRAGELAMLSLRLSAGLNFADFTAKTGRDARQLFAPALDQLSRVGLIEIDSTAIRLTRSGLNVADAVAGEFLLVDA